MDVNLDYWSKSMIENRINIYWLTSYLNVRHNFQKRFLDIALQPALQNKFARRRWTFLHFFLRPPSFFPQRLIVYFFRFKCRRYIVVQPRGTVIHVDCRSHCQSQLSNVLDVNGTDRRADNARQLRDGPREVKPELYSGSWILNDRLFNSAVFNLQSCFSNIGRIGVW